MMEIEPKSKKKKFDKKKIGTIIGVGLAIVLAIVFIIVISGRKTSTNNSNNEINNPTITTIEHAIGETANYEGLNITIKDYEFSDFFAGIEPDSHTNNTLLIVKVSVTNTTNKTINLYSSLLSYKDYLCEYDLIYNESINYGDRWSSRYTDFLRTHDSIGALSTIEASLCYQVPGTVKNSSEKLEIKLYNGKNDATLFHYWTLRPNPVVQ